jgi:hypothetical protein
MSSNNANSRVRRLINRWFVYIKKMIIVMNYVLYLFSLILSIILYFSFVTLQYTHSLNNGTSKIINQGAKVGQAF